MSKRRFIAVGFTAIGLVCGLVSPANAGLSSANTAVAATQLISASWPQSQDSCAGVWVVVDTGSQQITRCAKSYSTGLAALKSAGFTVTESIPGFVGTINNYPPSPAPSGGWWSYWQAAKPAAGAKWGAWQVSDVGAGASHPVKGAAEGWRYTTSAAWPPADKPAFPPRSFAKTPKPSISGKVKVGQTIQAKVALTPKAKHTYTWYLGAKAIKGAKQAKYVVKASDKGKLLSVKVTAKRSGYATVTVQSKAKNVK